MNTKIQKSFLLAESGVYWRILTRYEHKNSKILFCGANLPQHSLQNRENCFVSSKFTADIMLAFFNTLFYCGIILTVADLHKKFYRVLYGPIILNFMVFFFLKFGQNIGLAPLLVGLCPLRNGNSWISPDLFTCARITVIFVCR